VKSGRNALPEVWDSETVFGHSVAAQKEDQRLSAISCSGNVATVLVQDTQLKMRHSLEFLRSIDLSFYLSLVD
jgi:hypothetical protein